MKILTDRQRNENIDLIRVIAGWAVVGLHSFAKDEEISSWFYYLCGFAVPFFFMASGFFLLNRGKLQWMYCVNKILGIIKIIFCWNVLVILLKVMKSILTNEQISYSLLSIPVECAKALVQKGNMWQLWYLGALLLLYGMVWGISRFNEIQKTWTMIACAVIGIVISMYSLICREILEANVIQTFRLWIWLFYFILGSNMDKFTRFIQKYLSLRMHIFFAVTMTGLNVALQEYISSLRWSTLGETRIYAEYYYDNVFEIIWIICIFSVLLRVSLSEKLVTWIKWFVPLTLGIYIVHPIILRCVIKLIGNKLIWQSALVWFLTIFISTIFTWLIAHTHLKDLLMKI